MKLSKGQERLVRYVAACLLKQGKYSIDAAGRCVYRSTDGTSKCGIGHLIPDTYYRSSMESYSAGAITRTGPLSEHIVGKYGSDAVNYTFLDAVQCLLHDDRVRPPVSIPMLIPDDAVKVVREFMENCSISELE